MTNQEGIEMAKNENEKTVTVEDVVAEAEKTNLLHEKKVPAQKGQFNDASVPEGGNESGYTEDKDLLMNTDGEINQPKKSFGARLKASAEKLKANKKGVIITLAVVGAATVAVVKFSAKTVVEEIVESSTEEVPVDGDKQDDSTPDA